MSLSSTFGEFADKGAKDKSGKFSEISDKGMKRWFTDAKAFGKECSSNNLDIAFSAVKVKGKTTLTSSQMETLIEKVAERYGKDHKCADKADAIAKLTETLINAKKQTHGTTGTSKTGNVAGMTDTSKYTGSHKERFDAEGKGKGAAGREDKVDNTGYVGNYKGSGTYDSKH